MSTLTVILPVKNGGPWLTEALTSVRAQTSPPDEVIVVDGHSTDDSAAIAARFDGRVVPQPDHGVAAGLNLGVAEARGDLVAFIACDDRWRPDKLALQRARFAADPDLGAVFGHVRFFLEEGCAPPAGFRTELFEGVHPGRLLETMVVRRATLDAVGPFRTDLAIATDVDWFARLSERGTPTLMLPDVLLDKRVHDRNNAGDARRNTAELLKALRSSIQRRRSAAPDHG